MDVVYVLGNGSRWKNNEIRFSLRSIEKNLTGVGNVFIVGVKPDFLQNVIHIEADDIFEPGINADGNIITKVLAACNDERLSDDFLFINDDHLVLKPTPIWTVEALHKGNMERYEEDYWKLNYWRTRLKRTMETLVERGLPAYHFDCHTPIIFNKEKFKEVMAGFDYQSDIGLTMKSLYGNSVYNTNKIRVKLSDQKKTIFKNYKLDEIEQRLKRCRFMSFNDDGLNKALIRWLAKTFPTKSGYEKTEMEDRVVEIIAWLNSERDYREGVALFKKYMNGRNLIALFEGNETPGLRKKLEYKLTHVFDEI